MLKVVLRPVLSLHGLSGRNISLDELSTLISSALATKTMMKHGSLQVRLAQGWGLSGAPTLVYRISVTLNCLVEEVVPAKRAAVAAAVS